MSSGSLSADAMEIRDDFSGSGSLSHDYAQLILKAEKSFVNPQAIHFPLATGAAASAAPDPSSVIAQFGASVNCWFNVLLIAQDVDLDALTWENANYPDGDLYSDPDLFAGPFSIGRAYGFVGTTVDGEGAGWLNNLNAISGAGNSDALSRIFGGDSVAGKTFYAAQIVCGPTVAGVVPGSCTFNASYSRAILNALGESSGRSRPYVVPGGMPAIWP